MIYYSLLWFTAACLPDAHRSMKAVWCAISNTSTGLKTIVQPMQLPLLTSSECCRRHNASWVADPSSYMTGLPIHPTYTDLYYLPMNFKCAALGLTLLLIFSTPPSPSPPHPSTPLPLIPSPSPPHPSPSPPYPSTSTSVGRAGTFCVLSSVLEQLKVEGIVDVFFTIHSLRQQQPGIVSTMVRPCGL